MGRPRKIGGGGGEWLKRLFYAIWTSRRKTAKGRETDMSVLDDFYRAQGSDIQAVISRLGAGEELVARLLVRFRDDESFRKLTDALAGGDTHTAFLMAHTLKGVCANLGIGHLGAVASEMTELLRAGDIDAARELYPALELEYANVSAWLGRLEQPGQ